MVIISTDHFLKNTSKMDPIRLFLSMAKVEPSFQNSEVASAALKLMLIYLAAKTDDMTSECLFSS